MEPERDVIDEFLDGVLGTEVPTYEDITIESLFEDDPIALRALEATVPRPRATFGR